MRVGRVQAAPRGCSSPSTIKAEYPQISMGSATFLSGHDSTTLRNAMKCPISHPATLSEDRAGSCQAVCRIVAPVLTVSQLTPAAYHASGFPHAPSAAPKFITERERGTWSVAFEALGAQTLAHLNRRKTSLTSDVSRMQVTSSSGGQHAVSRYNAAKENN